MTDKFLELLEFKIKYYKGYLKSHDDRFKPQDIEMVADLEQLKQEYLKQSGEKQ